MERVNTLGDARRAQLRLVAVCHAIDCRHRWVLDLDHVIKYVGEMHGVLPVVGHKHFSERGRCPVCKNRGLYIWVETPLEHEPLFNGLSYRVDAWTRFSNGIDTTVANVTHLEVAWAAYHSAIGAYPGKKITLRQGAFVLADSRMAVIRGGRERPPLASQR